MALVAATRLGLEEAVGAGDRGAWPRSKGRAPFLRYRKAIHTTNFDAAIDELQYLVQHPEETRDHTHDEQGRAEQREFLAGLRDFALALKADVSGGEAKP